jgi:hypothetical protein
MRVGVGRNRQLPLPDEGPDLCPRATLPVQPRDPPRRRWCGDHSGIASALHAFAIDVRRASQPARPDQRGARSNCSPTPTCCANPARCAPGTPPDDRASSSPRTGGSHCDHAQALAIAGYAHDRRGIGTTDAATIGGTRPARRERRLRHTRTRLAALSVRAAQKSNQEGNPFSEPTGSGPPKEVGRAGLIRELPDAADVVRRET